ncbi:MAG: hypothetical protein HY690_06595 [Chloroflexi bacterium]|nr:hypothetical protein [Chloroflexota bacterium]
MSHETPLRQTRLSRLRLLATVGLGLALAVVWPSLTASSQEANVQNVQSEDEVEFATSFAALADWLVAAPTPAPSEPAGPALKKPREPGVAPPGFRPGGPKLVPGGASAVPPEKAARGVSDGNATGGQRTDGPVHFQAPIRLPSAPLAVQAGDDLAATGGVLWYEGMAEAPLSSGWSTLDDGTARYGE